MQAISAYESPDAAAQSPQSSRRSAEAPAGVVEVFAGIGSVARGFADSGNFRTLLLNDIDPIVRKAYQEYAGEQAPYFDRDIRRLRSDTLARYIGEHAVAGLLG